jgi:hypothetical protein
MTTTMGRTCASVALAIATTLTAQSDPQSAPLEVTHGKPFVMVMVNGRGPFRFVIDTGTGAEAFISPELADELALPSAGQVRLSDPTGQGGQRVPLVTIQSLQVAGVEFTGVKAVRHALSDRDGSCQGLLGFVLFRNYLLTLDYPRRLMTLASGALEEDGERSVLPFRMPDGIPVVPLRIGGLEIDAQIDSGGMGLSLPERFASQLKFRSDPAFFANSQSLSTRFQLKAAVLDSDVQMGGYTFNRPFVEINPAFPLANFGSCAMQNFAFTFDQKNALVRFEASKQTIHLSATPTPMRIDNAPEFKNSEPSLVPVG